MGLGMPCGWRDMKPSILGCFQKHLIAEQERTLHSRAYLPTIYALLSPPLPPASPALASLPISSLLAGKTSSARSLYVSRPFIPNTRILHLHSIS